MLLAVSSGCYGASRSDDEAGGSGQGGAASGGRSGNGGRSAGGAAGTSATAGSSSGGLAGAGGSPSSGGFAGSAGASAGAAGAAGVGEVPVDVGPPQQGSCTPPCQLMLEAGSDLPGVSATLTYDFGSGTAVVTAGQGNGVISFSYETNQYGYGAWSSGSWWFAFTEPEAYANDSHSLEQDTLMTAQMENPSTGQVLLVVFSFGDQTVRIHQVRVPDCDAAMSAVCTPVQDCSAVEGDTVGDTTATCASACGTSMTSCTAGCISSDEGMSFACATCYAEFVACSAANCVDWCPGGGGNGCMVCQTDAGCHLEFMACSGLDYMPHGTLTLPLQ